MPRFSRAARGFDGVGRTELIGALRRMGSWLRPSAVPLAMALVVVAAAGWFAERQNAQIATEQLRGRVVDQIAFIRARLEGNITSSIQLVRGLVAVVATDPDIDQAAFSALAEGVFDHGSQLRSVAAAPDLVVSMTYPLEANRAAIGLDYRLNPDQREAALRARDSGELVLAGPLELVQGGLGLVGRFPVFHGNGGPESFWGLISAVIDVERLYADSGLTEAEGRFDIALRGRDATGVAGPFFYGAPAILDRDPVTAEIVLPTGTWQMFAVPRAGWTVRPDNVWHLRLTFIFGGLLILVPISFAGRLIAERQATIGTLNNREEQLARLSRRLELALGASKVGVWEMDIVTDELVWDERMNELYGLPADGGRRTYGIWRQRLHPDDLDRATADFRDAIASGEYRSQFRVVHDDGDVRVIRTMGAVFPDTGRNPKLVGVNWDVTEDETRNAALERARRLSEARNRQLEAAKARIEHNALHDSLTGLPNRRYLDEMLREWQASGKGRRSGIALLHMDLDRFKQINDTLGHAAGDAVLVNAARVLKASVGKADFVARIGGDEFVIVCSARGGEAGLAELAESIVAQMRRPVAYENHECRCGVSIGIAVEKGGVLEPKRLMVNADIALYRAKALGRNRFEFFSEALQAEVVTTKRTADEILRGLEAGAFEAHYQLQFDAYSHAVVGAEALARWRHPERGLLGPDAFLAVAEELNVLAQIDEIILEKALADLGRWQAEGCAVPRVSVNVSLKRLHDEDLIKSLRKLKFAPGSLAFELVESIYLDESDEIVAFNLDHIKELGIDVEIDDFGTGYASIVSLQNLRPKRLKVDRQLVDPVVEDAGQRRLVASIVDIGKSLGIEVLAEGVETLEHARVLARLGCDALQGYAFARPMPADEIAPFLKAQTWLRAG
jgi:diguanylate cyclase (GGDEF)-like protein